MRIAAAHLGQPQPARHRTSKIRISRDTTWAARGQVSHRASGTRHKRDRRDSRPTPDTPLRDLHPTPRVHERHAIGAAHSPSPRAARDQRDLHPTITSTRAGIQPQTLIPALRAGRPPGSIRRRCSTLPSFVYRQEVFELSIVASSIAHAHEEADRRLTISHKHTTWAKVGARNAQQRAIRQPSSQAGNEKATRSSPYQ